MLLANCYRTLRSSTGAGIPHDELVSLAKPLLETVRATSNSSPPASKYIGGDCRIPAPGPQVPQSCITRADVHMS